MGQRLSRLISAAGEAEADDANAIITTAMDPLGRVDGDEPVDVALHQQGLQEAGRDRRVEPPGFGVSGDRLLEQARVAARVDESREKLGIVAVARGLVQESDHTFAGPARIGLEIRIELVRQRESRVQGDRPDECFLGASYRCRASGRCICR